MIHSAEEFIALRTSEVMDEYNRAAHDDAPLELWFELIRDHPDMREWVAHNKTVPPEVLKLLAADDNWRVRYTVAYRRKADPETLAKLATDADEGVRIRVAYNPKTPEHVLRLLLDDPLDEIREKARSRLSQPDE